MAGAAEQGRAVALVAGAPPRTGSRAGSRTGSRTQRLHARALTLPPVLIALALAGAAMLAHLALWGTVAPWGSAGAAGAVLAAAGAVWAVWARALYGVAHTPVGMKATPLQLIEEGPYRVGRNPMYLGTVIVLLGAAAGLGVPLLAVGALAFGAIVNAVHIPHEEAQLTRRFGGWYRDYAGTRRRWV